MECTVPKPGGRDEQGVKKEHSSQAHWYKFVMPAFGKERQEDQEFWALFGYRGI